MVRRRCAASEQNRGDTENRGDSDSDAALGQKAMLCFPGGIEVASPLNLHHTFEVMKRAMHCSKKNFLQRDKQMANGWHLSINLTHTYKD